MRGRYKVVTRIAGAGGPALWSAAVAHGVTVTVVVAGAIGAVYWMRQGGDFMRPGAAQPDVHAAAAA